VHKGVKLMLALAAEGLRHHYKLDDVKVSEVLGSALKLSASKRKAVLTAFGFPVKAGGHDVPFYVCMIYVVAELLLGKTVDDMALILGEDREKACAMYQEGLKWVSKLAYVAARLTRYARSADARELGARLIGDSLQIALTIYSASNSNMSVYGLYRNLSKDVYQFPSEEDAEKLKAEIETLLNGTTLEQIMNGRPIPPPPEAVEGNGGRGKRQDVSGELLERFRSLKKKLFATLEDVKSSREVFRKMLEEV